MAGKTSFQKCLVRESHRIHLVQDEKRRKFSGAEKTKTHP